MGSLHLIDLPQLSKTAKGNRIAFIGPMGSGKTWSANYLVNHRQYTRVSLAAKLKGIAYEMFGVQGKDGNDRLILQGLGTDLRKYDEDVWLKYLLADVAHKELQTKNFKPVIDDVRYLNEANVLHKNGFIIIRLLTDPELTEARLSRLYPNRPATALLHASETEQKLIAEDYTFTNDKYTAPNDLETLIDDIINL